MRSKEEILKSLGITEQTEYHNYAYLYKAVLKAMDEFANQPKWISVDKELPPIEINVLVYYKLKKSKPLPNEDEYHHYMTIGKVNSVTNYKESISAEWIDNEYNALNPEFWMPLPQPPNEKP